MKKINPESGLILIYEVLIIFVFSLIMLGIITYAVYQLKLIRATAAREQAFQIAEAGINYYQWHLAHFPTDYQDGTGNPGPYVHDYVDRDTQQTIGQFSLEITPPSPGSTIVTIQSTGYTSSNPNTKRVITTRYGIPSLAKYGFLTNSDAWIGDTESVSGEFHTNGGVRFDGTGNAPITSSKNTYSCGATFGCSPAQVKPGVWGSAPPATKNFWQFPVPNVDFSSITANLAAIKGDAQTAGIYLPPSNAQGYSLVFNANGTVSIYRVTSLLNDPVGHDVNGNAHNENIDYNNRTKLDGDPGVAGVQDYAIPANGLIFVEDRTWVEGTLRGRALVAAGKLPYNAATAPSIIVQNNLVYSAKDGSDSLGLIAQKDFLIAYQSPDVLEIDAAIIAQNGSAQRWNFSGNVKNSITIYGSVSSYGIWTWSWVNGSGVIVSGYTNTQTTYDNNLLFGPPPSFPLTPDGYQQLSWTSN